MLMFYFLKMSCSCIENIRLANLWLEDKQLYFRNWFLLHVIATIL